MPKFEKLNTMRWRRRSIEWTLIFGVWTILGLIATSQLYYERAVRGRPLSFVKALIWQMSALYVVALATPVVLWLARRYPVERRNWARRLACHLLASFVFSTVVTFFHIIIDTINTSGIEMVTLAVVNRNLPVIFDRVVFVYWTILLLSHTYDYYTRYQSGLLKAAELRAQLARAELHALKMQLNPHFLFNTLNAISELIHKDPDAADETITLLSDMLRSTLDKTGVEEVTLKQELEFLERYFAIERTRMGNRLRIEMQVAPDVLDAQVPNMLLQPLVENAVRHGLAPCAAGGIVRIEAARADGSLQLRITDTGRGLSYETSTGEKNFGNGNAIADVSQSGASEAGASETCASKKIGVGLSNTRARLAHLYGSSSRFDMRPALPHGLSVCIEIPFREDSRKDEQFHQSLDR